jgi:glycerol-3-phosphate dehydrogenase (NAD(P)+)
VSRQPAVGVIGAGSWGTTVASIVARKNPTILWARRPEVAEEISTKHTNNAYLGDLELHRRLMASSSLEATVSQADVLIMGVPSHGFRDVLEKAAPYVRPWIPVVSLTKGLEQGTDFRMTEVIADVLPGHPAGILAGPNLAREVLEGYAAAAVVAMPDLHVAAALQDIVHTTLFRVYSSQDVIGAELAGALKNVYAIAAGMASGLSTGDNTRALVIARALAELTRLGVAMGGQPETFAGLSGMGDLLATCISPLSRNRKVGVELAQGKTIEEIINSMNMVAEGVKTSKVVMELADRHGIDLPMAQEVYCVCHEGKKPEEAFRGLLRSKPTTEQEAG